MNTYLQETTKKIKQSLRLSMNGVVSTHQRRQGLDYKINFGVEVPRLKAIAQEYKKDKELATTLWRDNIRECKLLAIFLLPQESYNEIAEEWVNEVPFTEIADHLAMNILSKLPTATEEAFKWLNNEKGLSQYCGYLTLAHTTRNGRKLTGEEENTLFGHITTLFANDNDSLLKHTAFTTLCRHIDTDNTIAERALAVIPTSNPLALMIKTYIAP